MLKFIRKLATIQASLLFVTLVLMVSCNSDQQTAATDKSTPAATPAEGQADPEVMAAASPTPPQVFKSGRAVPVGFIGYKVNNSWYKTEGAQTNLYIDLSLINTDQKDHGLPPLKLVDDSGTEYSPNEQAWKSEGSVGMIEKLEPLKSQRANLIFSVPRKGAYKLKIQDGKPVQTVFIALEPTNKPPAPARENKS